MTGRAVRLSVALCTYNGGPYLGDQLASIAGQTRPPDELVVCDDGSSDDTVAVLGRFAADAPFPVRWSVNPATLGSTRNFDRAVNLCHGDLIATCDQDDIWRPDKLAVMEAVFRDDPGVALAASDADLIGPGGEPAGGRLWDAVGFAPAHRAEFAAGRGVGVLIRQTCLTGATMVFRAGLRDLAGPFPQVWVHDAWLAFIAAAAADIRLVLEPLVQYRLHPRQQIGLGVAPAAGRAGLRHEVAQAGRLAPEHFAALGDRYATLGTRLRAIRDRLHNPTLAEVVTAEGEHFHARAAARARPLPVRLSRVLAELAGRRYARFGLGPLGLSSAAADLLLPPIRGDRR